MTGFTAIPSLPTAVYWLSLADYSRVRRSPNPPFYFSTTQFRNGLKQAGTRTSATGSSPWTPTMFSLAKRPGVFLCNEAVRRPLEATTPLA
jgi:hypothetical protein